MLGLSEEQLCPPMVDWLRSIIGTVNTIIQYMPCPLAFCGLRMGGN